MEKWFRDLYHAAVLAGIILLLIGVCFMLIKGGIPYQDPTPEMQISYAAWWRAGKLDVLWGIVLLLVGLSGHLLYRPLRGEEADDGEE